MNSFFNAKPGVTHLLTFASALILVAVCGAALAAPAADESFFEIKVLDAETDRGVPLVEVRTVNGISYLTDSHGLIAFREPGLMDQNVFFHIRSHGYEYPPDGFENRGVALSVQAGTSATIKIKRLNVAERLYRVTGQGIYRDSVLLGRPVPLRNPVINGKVMGQDTVIASPYRGKIYWFWGDTERVAYPLGNFGGSGATSEWPGRGGLDPSVGVDLTYFVDQTGFSKPMCPNFGPGLQWIESLMTLRDEQGVEKLVARVASADGMKGSHDWHVAVFNDEREVFESIMRWEKKEDHDSAHPFKAVVGTNEYIYLYPNYRVKADLTSLTNLAAYEAFTCRSPGASDLNRDANGQLRYGWHQGAERLTNRRLGNLIKSGAMKADEAWRRHHDVETGRPIQIDRGSVTWNKHRRCWVMIGSGAPGETWFSSGDTPLGPWVYARRVVGHKDYNFYNPAQHSFFDQDNGRLIYFEATYTDSFSGAKEKTPRYDYNQIMYRLDLDDARLVLPVPIYVVRDPKAKTPWMWRDDVDRAGAWDRIESIPFFGIPPDRHQTNLILIGASLEDGVPGLKRASVTDSTSKPVFYALPPEAGDPDPGALTNLTSSAAVAPLYEYRHSQTGKKDYSIGSELADPNMVRAAQPLCRVWRNPMRLLILDATAKPF